MYKLKPICAEAFRLTREARTNLDSWPKWMRVLWNKEPGTVGSIYPSMYPNSDGKDHLRAQITRDIDVLIGWGDYIVRFSNGQLGVVPEDEFNYYFEEIS